MQRRKTKSGLVTIFYWGDTADGISSDRTPQDWGVGSGDFILWN